MLQFEASIEVTGNWSELEDTKFRDTTTRKSEDVMRFFLSRSVQHNQKLNLLSVLFCGCFDPLCSQIIHFFCCSFELVISCLFSFSKHNLTF